jgi:putative transposase
MGRPKRVNAGGLVYHVLNRANAQINAQIQVFETSADYAAFERVLTEANEQVPMRLLAHCVMPNHWHLVLWPRNDGDLSKYVGWLTLTHTQRWRASRGNTRKGHLYQSRFKSFVVQPDEHLLSLWHYVEGNPLRAGLVDRAEDWRWSSAWRRRFGDEQARALLADGPVARPGEWWQVINTPQSEADLKAIRRCGSRGAPFGSDAWVRQMVEQYDLATTLRARGRPRKR